MELEELKRAWTKSYDDATAGNRDIFDLIQNKSAGPAARLKRRFKKGMILIPFITTIGIVELWKKVNFMPHVMAWFLLGFGVLMMIYFYLNYRFISRIQTLEGNVKHNLQRQVQLLKNGLRWRLLITRGIIISFIILTELLMYLNIAPELENWQHQQLIWRLTVYAGYIIFFYLVTKFATDLRYKKHILRLEELIEQMK